MATPLSVVDPIATSTNTPNHTTVAEQYSGAYQGIRQVQNNEDILRRASVPDHSSATTQYLTTCASAQPRSLSLPEASQSPESFLSSTYVSSWPESSSGGAHEQGLLSRKRLSRSSFIEPPSVRLKGPNSNTPSSANRPQRCTSTFQSTPTVNVEDSVAFSDHIPMPNPSWGASVIDGPARASTYISQSRFSSSIFPSTLNPGVTPEAATQRTYTEDQDWNNVDHGHGTTS